MQLELLYYSSKIVAMQYLSHRCVDAWIEDRMVHIVILKETCFVIPSLLR